VLDRAFKALYRIRHKLNVFKTDRLLGLLHGLNISATGRPFQPPRLSAILTGVKPNVRSEPMNENDLEVFRLRFRLALIERLAVKTFFLATHVQGVLTGAIAEFW
jgi:hypothetical protein